MAREEGGDLTEAETFLFVRHCPTPMHGMHLQQLKDKATKLKKIPMNHTQANILMRSGLAMLKSSVASFMT